MHRKTRIVLVVLFLSWLCLCTQAQAFLPPDFELPPPPPTANAAAYLLMDAQSGSLLAAANIDSPMAPASLAKMMTVYVVGQELRAGRVHLEDMVVIGERAWRMGGSRMFLDLGKAVSISDLLDGVIVLSGNDAAVALAEHVAGSEQNFVRMMNETAQSLGMTNTRFANSSGMPHQDMHASARDLATLALALIRDHPDLYARHANVFFEYNSIQQRNRNQLLRLDASVDGIKTGFTRAAGYCLAASAKRGDMRLVSVVLGSDSAASRNLFSRQLLEYGFAWYETRRITTSARPMGTARVWKSFQPEIVYGVVQDLYLTLPRGMFDLLEKRISLAEGKPLVAPVRKYQKLGDVTLSVGDMTLFNYDLVALSEAPQAGLWHQVVDTVRLMFQ